MDDLREIKQALVDAKPFFKTNLLLIWTGSAITNVVRDFFWTCEVDKVQVTACLQVLFVLLDYRIDLESEERMRSTRAMVEKGLSVMSIFLTIFDQLKHLIYRCHIDLISTFNDQILLLIFMNA